MNLFKKRRWGFTLIQLYLLNLVRCDNGSASNAIYAQIFKTLPAIYTQLMPIEKDGKLLLTLDDLEPIVQGDGIVDGTLGGLILGNSHSEGGIKVIRQYKNEKLYEILAEVEGYEYLLNPFVTIKEMQYLKMLNLEFTGTNEKFIEYDFPKETRIIDTKPIFANIKETNKYIILDNRSQWIINKHSTKKYLIELDNLNKKHCL